jgi:hypothetical protein
VSGADIASALKSLRKLTVPEEKPAQPRSVDGLAETLALRREALAPDESSEDESESESTQF